MRGWHLRAQGYLVPCEAAGVRWIPWLVCAACGSVDSKSTDASVDSPGDGERDADVAQCDVTKSFGAPVLLPGVNGASHDRWGAMSRDELTLYFSNIPAMGNDTNIYTAVRASTSDPFSSPTLLPGVNTTATEEHPSITDDGLTLVADSNAFGNLVDVAIASRSNTASSFGALAPVSGINTSGDEEDVSITGNGLELWFTSNRNGNNRIFRATRGSTSSTFGTPAEVTELTTAGSDGGPVVSADGLEIFYHSDRSGGSSGLDIWHATRASATGTFGSPVRINELDSDSPELVSWLSADRCRLLFASNRLGSYDIYIATRPH
jgi:hypothetical protein